MRQGPSAGATADSPYRAIPSVAALLADPQIRALSGMVDDVLAEWLRRALAGEREAITAGQASPTEDVRGRVLRELGRFERSRLAPAINATGVIVHTNLGRAPVSAAAAAAMAEAAASAVALEIEPESGARGGRLREVSDLMRVLTGAESTVVVNNNAAAVLLVLSALAAGREVILSRGETVEIGGGFRIPDVLRQSGARLVEVGTTNRTYPNDYVEAVSAETAALLKVHPSNFRVTGFVRGASIAELAPVASDHGLALVEDLGSGALLDTRAFGLAAEPTIADSLREGASIVTASGDKLLGGPQAGLICGDGALVARIERHPLARAVRADKTCLAGLAATLRHYARGEAVSEIPVWRAIAADLTSLEGRAHNMRRRLAGSNLTSDVTPTESTVGGGSLPGETLPSFAVALNGHSRVGDIGWLERFARHLRSGQPGVFGRIEGSRLLLDLRTVFPEDDDRLTAAVEIAAAEARGTG